MVFCISQSPTLTVRYLFLVSPPRTTLWMETIGASAGGTSTSSTESLGTALGSPSTAMIIIMLGAISPGDSDTVLCRSFRPSADSMNWCLSLQRGQGDERNEEKSKLARLRFLRERCTHAHHSVSLKALDHQGAKRRSNAPCAVAKSRIEVGKRETLRRSRGIPVCIGFHLRRWCQWP